MNTFLDTGSLRHWSNGSLVLFLLYRSTSDHFPTRGLPRQRLTDTLFYSAQEKLILFRKPVLELKCAKPFGCSPSTRVMSKWKRPFSSFLPWLFSLMFSEQTNNMKQRVQSKARWAWRGRKRLFFLAPFICSGKLHSANVSWHCCGITTSNCTLRLFFLFLIKKLLTYLIHDTISFRYTAKRVSFTHTHTCILIKILSHYRLLWNTESNSLWP